MLERKFRKSGLTVDQQQFELKCAEYNSLLETSKCSFYKSKIEQKDRNQLFRLVDGFFTTNKPVLPTYNSLDQLAEDFNDFFINKIRDIRMELFDSSTIQPHHSMEQRILHCEFSEFILPSKDCIKDIISSFSNKTCSLDPIPTHVVKDNINSVLPFITGIVSQSFASGVFPATLKTSQVRPKLKKPDLKTDLFASYRPIANIPFLSKVIEKSAAIQVHNYLNSHNLFPT
jgi:hypothetical protein